MTNFDHLHEGAIFRLGEAPLGPSVENAATAGCRRRAVLVGDAQNLIDFDHLRGGSLTDRYWD